jgi:hypothetical protein
MSVLDDFVRMRLYRKRAAEFEKAIEQSLPIDVQKRYRIIASHYRLLAESEERSEKARAISRLANWKNLRKPENWLVPEAAQKITFPRSPLSAADLMEEAVRELLQRAAKNPRLETASTSNHEQRESPNDLPHSQNLPRFLLPRHRATQRKASFVRWSSARRAGTRGRP